MSPCDLLCVRLLAFLGLVGLSAAQNITEDSFFYGQSPPVYPSPTGTGTGDWAAAYAKATKFVSQLSIEEKANLTFGVDSTANGCAGNIPAIARLGFPGLCLQDAGNGVRATDFVNSYASGIHVGASWNKDLSKQRGVQMGGEFRAKGVNVALGPVVGPLGRMVESGRDWEGFSNDPYLCGAMAFEAISGVQSTGVITSTKHFIGNEQETNRNPSTDGKETIASVSSNIDDKTIHELYLWPFQDAVHAGTGNIMCSYNRVNNSYACSNSQTLNGFLKGELGFQGFVVSDWGAQHAGYTTSLAGLDMAMPNSPGFWADGLLVESVKNGSVPESRLDDQATRIIATWYKMGQDTNYTVPGIGMPFSLTEPHPIVNAKNPDSKNVLMDLAVEGHVLVKNVNNALPLKTPQLLSIFGYDAVAPGQEDVDALWTFGQESLIGFLGSHTTFGGPIPQIAINGTIISGGGSGANSPSYIDAPLDALQRYAYLNNSAIYWDTINVDSTAAVNPASDACLVFINAFATEGIDRPGLHDDYSDALVNNIADQCSNTMVIIHNAGIRLVDQFIDHPNVTAVIFAHLPGQDSGRSLVHLLYGEENFSGKLPYTVAKNESDYGAALQPSQPVEPFGLFPQSNFTEGIFIDYRAFDAKNITPRYEFGFGLSYTSFAYSNLGISKTNATGVNLGPFPTGEILPGGHVDLWDTLATVKATIKNTGPVAGKEIAQLYLGIPGGPIRQLRGFSKVSLKPGGTADVVFDVTRRDLSTWDVAAQNWNLQSGSYNVFVGASSRDLPLTGTLVI